MNHLGKYIQIDISVIDDQQATSVEKCQILCHWCIVCPPESTDRLIAQQLNILLSVSVLCSQAN